MSYRGWGNGLAAAGLLLVVGVAVAQAPSASLWYWSSLCVTAALALFAIFLLRPRGGDLEVERFMHLRSQTTDRDMAFLLAGTRVITFPKTLSQHSALLGPPGERWTAESKEEAAARAQKLITLGLMEPRGATEVETSVTGRAVVALDVALKAKHRAEA